MPYFEIVYSKDAATKALASKSVNLRSRVEAAEQAMRGLADATRAHDAKYFRILDWQGMVVARGPSSGSE